MDVLVHRITQQVMGYGLFTAPPVNPDWRVRPLPASEEPKLEQPGVKRWNTGGVLTVEPPAAPTTRPKTRAEYRAEYDNPLTLATRRQQIRDIVMGLADEETVPL